MYIVIVLFLLWGLFRSLAKGWKLASHNATSAAQSHFPPLMIEFGELSNHQLVLNLLSQEAVLMHLHYLQQYLIRLLVSKHLQDGIRS